MGYRVVSSSPKKRSELEQFAMWFHQNWSVFFPTFEEAASAYLRQLPAERKVNLRGELAAFLEKNAAATRGGLPRGWLKLGAQGGPTDLQGALMTFLTPI